MPLRPILGIWGMLVKPCSGLMTISGLMRSMIPGSFVGMYPGLTRLRGSLLWNGWNLDAEIAIDGN